MIQKGVVKFRIHDKLYTGNDVPADTTLNDYIRNYAHLKGTKFMCLEGGCGACIVAIKRKNPVTQKEEIFAVNSCLISVFSCYGWSVITVEGIGNKRNGYHKIQSALAGFSGTQCGYCSPGMVMNMFSLLNSHDKVTMADVENSFGGNICRCTGYRPILDAFKSLASDATPELKQKCVDIENLMDEINICPKTKEICRRTCVDGINGTCDIIDEIPNESFTLKLGGSQWYRVTQKREIFEALELVQDNMKYMLVAGNTAHGVYRIKETIDIYIDINEVAELKSYSVTDSTLTVGANMSLTSAIDLFNKLSAEKPDQYSYLKQIAKHIDLVANVPVRNVGTIAGNLSIKYVHNEFPSDIFLLLETVGARLTIEHLSGSTYTYPLQDYLVISMDKKVILNVIFPAYNSSNFVFNSYKIMQRSQNTHAYVNAGFAVKVDKNNKFKALENPTFVFGGISSAFIHASKTEDYVNGKNLLDLSVVKEACNVLNSELAPDEDPTKASQEYRRTLAVNLFYKFVLSLSPDADKYKSGGTILSRELSSGKQDFQTDKSLWPVNKPIPKLEAIYQCSGEAEFVNDIPSHFNELYGALVISKKGPGTLAGIDISEAMKLPGVVKFISAKDIPGKNTVVELNPEESEQLFADKEIKYAGQFVGMIVAKTQAIANKAAGKVVVTLSDVKKPLIDLKQIVDSNDKARIFKHAEKAATKKKDDIKFKFEGSFLIGGQYHFTMETQSCYCVPNEDGIDVYPSSQWITAVQACVSAALNIPDNSVNVSVKRCGGGYGSKLGRSTLVATACAVAANNLQAPVKIAMQLETNMESIGKRFPLYAQYEVAVNLKGEIQFLNVNTYTDHGGLRIDSLFGAINTHIENVYDSSTFALTMYDVLTDGIPNTYARAPGSTEGVALIEHIMEHIAKVTNLDPVAVRFANISSDHNSIMTKMVDDVKNNADYVNKLKLVEQFNTENRWKKKGLSLVIMNYPYQAMIPYHVLISVYGFDGTISIAHGGIEIGQGINTKVAQVCAYTLGIDLSLIKIKATNNLIAPNDGPTGGSMASDAVSYATIECCKILLERLKPIKEKNPGASWQDIAKKAVEQNVDLCAEYMYTAKTATTKGYNIYGSTITEVEVDVLTGQYLISRVDLLEDVGQSMSPDVDIGQVEGAFVMGLGYWLTEKLIFDKNTGALLTNRTWNYTPPGAKDIPIDFRVYFRRDAPNPSGVLRSKATGEPPLCMSIGVVFAIRNAIASARKDAGLKDEWFPLNLPYTPENVQLSCKTSIDQFNL